MGVGFSVKNSKHEVTMDLQDGKSVISFKVKDRRNAQNPQHYIHYKRYKQFQLPPQIKAKFKKVAQFHQYLSENAGMITLGQKDVIIQLDGEKISIPFENVSQERNELSKNINIVIGDEVPNGRRTKALGDSQDEKCKDSLKGVLRKMVRKNNPLRQLEFKGQSMSNLVQMLKEQWEKFDKNGPTVPNMTKKKTQQIPNETEDQSKSIVELKAQIQKQQKEMEALKIQFQCYKTCFNFEKFNEEQRKSQEATRKRVIDEFLVDISDHFNRVTSSANISGIMVQIKTKAALFSRIENTVKQLEAFKSQQQANYQTVKKEVKSQKEGQQKSSAGFSEIIEGEDLNQLQKLEISKRLDI